MATLFRYMERGREYIVLTEDEPTDEEFEEEYAAKPLNRILFEDNGQLSQFPTERGLSEA